MFVSLTWNKCKIRHKKLKKGDAKGGGGGGGGGLGFSVTMTLTVVNFNL